MREGGAFSPSLLIPAHPEIPFQFASCTILLTAELLIYLGCAAKVERLLSLQLPADPGLPACPCAQDTAVIVTHFEELKILH